MLHNLAIREAAQFLINAQEEGGEGQLPKTIEQNWGQAPARRLQRLAADPRLGGERGYLYIIPTEVRGVWKIGKTDNLKRRLGGYQTGRATPVTYTYTRATLEQHVAEKLLKELLKAKAYMISSADESKQQRLRELFQVELEVVRQLVDECCLTASAMQIFKMNLLTPLTETGYELASNERIAGLMQLVDRYVGALVHSHKMPGREITWFVPGGTVDIQQPLVDMMHRTEVRAEDMAVVQALLFDRLVASRTTCVVGAEGGGDGQQVLVKLRTPEEIRGRMGQVVYDFELAASYAAATEEAAAGQGSAEVAPNGVVNATVSAVVNAAANAAVSAASGTPNGEEKRARRNSLDQTREVQKFVDWVERTKPEWAKSGKAVTMQELHDYYKSVPELEGLGQRIVFGKVRELMKCEKIKVMRGEQSLIALKFP